MISARRGPFIPYAMLYGILTLLLNSVSVPSPADSSIWTNKGPDGGAIWCIAVDPRAPATLYVGTGGGGIFKSTDRGGSWTGANTGLIDFSIMAIAVDPRNSKVVYSATNKAGMFKSTDGGQSWTAINSGLPELSVGTLAIDPIHSETVYAGTTGAGVFKSTNGGRDWTAVNAGLKGTGYSGGQWIEALAIDRRNSETVYAGTGHEGVFKTVNGGETWTAVNTGFSSLSVNDLIIDPQDTNVLYAGIFGGQATGVWKTVNSGESWNPVPGIGLPQFNVVAHMVIDSMNPKTIYAVGYLGSNGMATGIFKSNDGGDTWTVVSGVPDSQIPPLAIDPHDSSTLYAGSTNSGMYKSTDGGSTWIHSSRGVSAVSVAGLAVDPVNSRSIYASTTQGVFKSIDGGDTWKLKLSNPTHYPVVIDPSNPAVIYVANGDVLKSTDGGESWRRLDGVRNIVALAIDPNNPKTLYGGEYNFPWGQPVAGNGVVRTDDGGETWRPANGGLPTIWIAFGFLAVDPGNSAAVYAATFYNPGSQRGSIYKSTDGGSTWKLVSQERNITAMALDTRHGGVVYAGTADKGLVKSVDGGASWFSLESMLKEKSITALAVNEATGALYAGSADGGIFKSTDAGDSWTQLNSGLTMPKTHSLAIDPLNVETVYAGTPGGVFKLTPLKSALNVEVPAGGVAVTSTAGSGRSVQSGYATVTIDSGSVPSGVAVFSFRQDDVVVSEVGAPASPATLSARIFVEYRSGVAVPGQYSAGLVDVNTGLALVNRGYLDAGVTYTLRNAAGTVVAKGHGSLAAGAHFAKFVNQLDTEARDFKLPDNFPTAVQFGSLDIVSDQPLSVLALRLTINQRNDALMTTTPTADLAVPLNNRRLYFPHFVNGGGYVTRLILINTSGAPEAGTMSFFSENGEPLIVKQPGGFGDSSFPYFIQPGGVFVFQADASPSTVNKGSVQLTPYAGTWTPMGAGVFGFSRNGVLVSESGIPAAEPTTHARIYIDQSAGHETGLALAAPSGSGLRVGLKAYQMDGSTPAGSADACVVLNQNGHSARFVSQLIPGLPPNFTGVMDISSESPFAALTLLSLANSRGDLLLTTFPVADSNRPPTFPTVFPQVADGGGIVTRFILLNATGTSKATLRLWGNSGTPLAIGIP